MAMDKNLGTGTGGYPATASAEALAIAQGGILNIGADQKAAHIASHAPITGVTRDPLPTNDRFAGRAVLGGGDRGSD